MVKALTLARVKLPGLGFYQVHVYMVHASQVLKFIGITLTTS